MKKTLSLVLTLTMIVSLLICVIPINAQETNETSTVTISTEKEEISVEEEFTVNVKITKFKTKLSNFDIKIYFDNNKLELKKYTVPNLIKDASQNVTTTLYVANEKGMAKIIGAVGDKGGNTIYLEEDLTCTLEFCIKAASDKDELDITSVVKMEYLGDDGRTMNSILNEGNSKLTTSVKVIGSAAEKPVATEVRLSETQITVATTDGNKTITATVYDKNGNIIDDTVDGYPSIQWSSNDTSTVDCAYMPNNKIMLKPKKPGTATITVTVTTTEGKTFTATCTVTVTEPTHEYILTHHDAKEATCTEAGNIEYWTCENCKKLFLDSEGKTETTLEVVTIPAKGHKYGALIPATKAVHTKDELTPSVDAHYKCSACGKLFIDKDGEKVETTLAEITGEKPTHNPSKEWSYDDNNHWHKCTGCDIKLNETEHNFIWKIDTEATEDKEGVKHEECECGKKRSENTKIDKLDHTHTNITRHPAEAATCTETGNIEYWTCSSDKCRDKYYSDDKCMNEIKKGIETPKDPDNHTGETKVEGAKEATCTENGATGKIICSSCNATIEESEEIKAKGHSYKHYEAKSATCSSDGNDEYYECETCKQFFDSKINPIDAKPIIKATGEHSYEQKWDKDYHWNECKNCEEVKENSKLAHTDEDGDNVCDECGYSMHTHDFSEAWTSNETHHWHECTGCDDIADKAKHIPSGWIVDREATHSRDGKMHRECKVCGYILEKSVIEAEGSDFDYSAWYYARQQLLNQTFRITAKAGVGGTITDEGTTGVKFGNSITYKITPDAGYEIEAVYVDGKNIGAVDEFTFSDVRGNAEISVTFKKSEKAPAIEAIDEDNSEVIDEAEEIVEAWVNPFIDIFESDDCYEAVRFVYENGIFRGVSENEFAPATTMTRAMFVTVLGRLAAVDESAFSGTSFSDVLAGEWYSAYVEWASRNGIINGYGDDTFGPNDEITVEQAAVIIARYAEFMGVEVESETTLDGFADAADVADWAADQMAWAVENGIYNTEEFLNPKAPASRSLIAEMLYAFSELN